MQVEIQKAKKVFNPITLKIVIESEEEFNILCHLTDSSCQVAHNIYSSEDYRSRLTNILAKIHQTLDQALIK